MKDTPPIRTCRDAVFEAFYRLERSTRREVFRLSEIVSEVLSFTTRYPATTIRTQVASIMCTNAPIHHTDHTDDLERVDRGRYRRIVPNPRWRPGGGAPPEPSAERPSAQQHSQAPASSRSISDGDQRRVLLIGCVATKGDGSAAAKDLYLSPLWHKRRAYAEASGRPWFILSAKHGLLHPDTVIDPYDVSLAAATASEVQSWSDRVYEQLSGIISAFGANVLEIHAGAAYAPRSLVQRLERNGVAVHLPLAGLAIGGHLSWYSDAAASRRESAAVHRDCDHPIDHTAELMHGAKSLQGGTCTPVPDVTPMLRDHGRSPGLYAWSVDASGAETLSLGIGHPISPGLLYCGQAGATRQPSGTLSDATLESRINGQHLNGRIRGSSFRYTLAACLMTPLGLEVAAPRKLTAASEDRLTAWMWDHLCLRIVPVENPDSLSALEADVVAELDPPLNLNHVEATPLRSAASAARRAIKHGNRP